MLAENLSAVPPALITSEYLAKFAGNFVMKREERASQITPIGPNLSVRDLSRSADYRHAVACESRALVLQIIRHYSANDLRKRVAGRMIEQFVNFFHELFGLVGLA
jgi:hypothetical protein